MKRRFVCSLLFTVGICVLSSLALANLLTSLTDGVAAAPRKLTQGALQITDRDGRPAGQCPLKHTAVKTAISGGLARTVVTQEEIPVELPETEPRHDVLATLWARTRIDDLMSQDYGGLQTGNAREEVREAITQLGLEYRLMTQFTSFVAVEEMTVTKGGQPRRIDVPVEMPEGVSWAGVFGEAAKTRQLNGQHLMRLSGSMGKMEKPSERASNRALAINSASVALPSASPPPATPAPARTAGDISKTKVSGGVLQDTEAKREQIGKLDPSIAAVIVRLQNRQAQTSTDEARFVRDGKAELQIWLVDKTAATLEELKKLGFEIVLNPSSSKLIIGRLPLEKLTALAALTAVKYVAPQSN